MSGINDIAKFSPSPDLCPGCTDVLLAQLKEPVLLHQSIFSLRRSANSCSLCRLMWRGLTGFSGVKNGPRSACNLFDFVDPTPGSPTAIWGRRQLVDYSSFGMNPIELHLGIENLPISFIEVMMVKSNAVVQLADEGRLSSKPESGKLENAVWGLSCDPSVVREAGGCPYVWEYNTVLREVGRRKDFEKPMSENWYQVRTPMELFSSTRPSNLWWGKG